MNTGMKLRLDAEGLRSIAFVVADSLRWDSYCQARTPNLDRWCGPAERRYSYATWTQPSHACLLGGLLPHGNAVGRPAAATYADDYAFWATVLGSDHSMPHPLYPEFCLALMATRCGWVTIGRVAMPVLNEQSAFSRGFDDYQLSPRGSTLGTQCSSLPATYGPRTFVFINLGETHYPYAMPPGSVPHLAGAHGVISRSEPSVSPPRLNDHGWMKMLHRSQVEAMERVDQGLCLLVERLPKPMLLLFTSDHGELFGEEGYFGHGPFVHPLLFEVPLAIGVIREAK